MDLLQFTSDVGFPIALAMAGGMFTIMALKYVFAGVIDRVDAFSNQIASTRDDIHRVQKQVIEVDYAIDDVIAALEDQ